MTDYDGIARAVRVLGPDLCARQWSMRLGVEKRIAAGMLRLLHGYPLGWVQSTIARKAATGPLVPHDVAEPMGIDVSTMRRASAAMVRLGLLNRKRMKVKSKRGGSPRWRYTLSPFGRWALDSGLL